MPAPTPPPCPVDDCAAWFAGRLPDDWFTGPVEVLADRDELLVIGTLPEPKGLDETDLVGRRVAAQSRIEAFREDTRAARMAVADIAQEKWGRSVSWAARCGTYEARFTHVSTPVMTRLRIDERLVLDTLVDAGVARSRSDALGWCVRLVGRNQAEWIERLRDAMVAVERIRDEGPANG